MTYRIRIGIATSVLLATGYGVGANPAQGDPVRDFVMPTYVHGVPYAKALQLGPGAVPRLVTMLDDPLMATHRANIATTLGILGTLEAERRLVQLIQSGAGNLTRAEVQVRLVALMSLGYAVYQPEPGDSMRYLTDGIRAEAWTKIEWHLPSGGSSVDRLRESAITALGLSGRPEAIAPLNDLLVPGGGGGRGGGGGGALPPAQAALVKQALSDNGLIRRVGLIEYYRLIDSK